MGRGRKAGCGGSEDIAGGEAQGFILYLIKAGLLPVRFRPPIAGRERREGPDRTESSGAPAGVT